MAAISEMINQDLMRVSEVGGVAFPTGTILVWSGLVSAIPADWTFCDGTAGTPNLTNKFVRGAPPAVEAGGLGGSDTHTLIEAELPAHNHGGSTNATDSHQYHYSSGAGINARSDWDVANESNTNAGGHGHTFTSNNQGGGGAHENRPAYLQLAFIMATADITGTLDSGIIAMWHGLIANIPDGWSLCDGGGGRPDLRSRFTRGAPAAVDPGGVGGSDTVALAVATMPSHGHSATSSLNGTHGYHYNSLAYYEIDTDRRAADNDWKTQPNHSHTVSANNTGSGNAHENRPAYYQILFIIKD